MGARSSIARTDGPRSRPQTATWAALVACFVALATLSCSEATAPEDAPEFAERPEVDPLESARKALAGHDWNDAIELAQLAIDAGVEVDDAEAIVEHAEYELENRAVLADARTLFEEGMYPEAFVTLANFPAKSAYATLVANMMARIRQAVVLPPSIRRRGGSLMRRIVLSSFNRGTSDKEAKRAHKLCEQYVGDCQVDWFDREKPRKRIIVGSFYLDEMEVSVAQYRACVASGACTAAAWEACGLADPVLRTAFDQPELPQVCVTWDQARSYCTSVGGRLPTEAEWERAASNADRFPWGESFHEARANWNDPDGRSDGYEKLAPVDAFRPEANHLRNMSGNAYEWVADWYAEDYYAEAPDTAPLGPESGTQRSIRGGAYNATPSSMRVAHRNRLAPTDANQTVGFRCAADPHQLPFHVKP